MIFSPTPRFAYIVPTLGIRNEALLRNLESLKNQVPEPFVVLVRPVSRAGEVDKIATDYVDTIVNDFGLGLSAAIQVGVDALPDDTSHFNWLGDDDYLLPGALQKFERAILSHPDASFVTGVCNYVNFEGKTFWANRPKPIHFHSIKFWSNMIPQPATIISIESYNLVKGVDLQLRFSMDLDLWLKLMRIHKPVFIRENIACYRWDGYTLSSANQNLAFMEAASVRLRNASYFLKGLVLICNFVLGILVKATKSKLDRLST